jgi:hypothetical protein
MLQRAIANEAAVQEQVLQAVVGPAVLRVGGEAEEPRFAIQIFQRD